MNDTGLQRYFMQLAYRGAPYHGWQSQPNAISVQEVIEDALAKVLRRPTPITGAGRTDTGVNARKMIAHFDAPAIADTTTAVRALNSIVGPDIAIYKISPVHSDAHARFDATSRTYHYYCTMEKTPFFHQLCWRGPQSLDFDLMNEAARMLLTTSDFTSFAKLHTDAKTNICHVSRAEWVPVEGGNGYVFVITADRFLRNMVRAVVGTLVEVGRGKLTLDGFKRVIEARDRCSAGTSMPAHALYLWDVTYPYYND
ncbi:MAG: tRNA pseudouridine(38-40) synthase TruA [Bacteroides sp.]|nr:tRNA pseudouridine(38-40) synthase TruA [Bacteroides sp.]MCM1413179.1 tRNA pseudouridine(38-40) synthase TruA [Bacteroides sp.]MCM1472079.1 tRNA pseudouridine(38-40) synthase TruA [Bacteroides sp.]